ncbi:hypothetical protein [Adhaeribacter soli]|uniref:Uncharacterized protein n=1 Tax=Adhaeribacter soli TaxID=2607655 RepID=A0A5N1IU60_9BACT|nr:hypothetical protein [Adhaeribacter soli]KAA9333735.1 hypothetical protein F0P94_10845 [Adhaeribacter soli]
MKVNFQLVDNYAISFEGRHIDVHNNFNFLGFEYKVETQTLILKWIKSAGDWVNSDELPQFALIHFEVNYLNITPRNPLSQTSEDTCLSDITFFPSSDRITNDSIIGQSMPHNKDDILYLFQNDQVIRVNCKEIRFIIGTEEI